MGELKGRGQWREDKRQAGERRRGRKQKRNRRKREEGKGVKQGDHGRAMGREEENKRERDVKVKTGKKNFPSLNLFPRF